VTLITSPRSESMARTSTTHSGRLLCLFSFCWPLPNSVFGSAPLVTVKVHVGASSRSFMINTSFSVAAPSWGHLPV
jgi:hypothetical protein